MTNSGPRSEEITLQVQDPNTNSEVDRVNSRLQLLGIELLDEVPEAEDEATALLQPEIAARLHAVPIQIDGDRPNQST